MLINSRKQTNPTQTGREDVRESKTQMKMPNMRHRLTTNSPFVSIEGKAKASVCHTSIGNRPPVKAENGDGEENAIPKVCHIRKPSPPPSGAITHAIFCT